MAAPRTIPLGKRPASESAPRRTGDRRWKPFSTQRAFLELVQGRRRTRRGPG